MAKLRWQLKWQKFSYFWLIRQTFVTVNLPWNTFLEAVLRPFACSTWGQLPPLITPLIGRLRAILGDVAITGNRVLFSCVSRAIGSIFYSKPGYGRLTAGSAYTRIVSGRLTV